MSDDTLAPSEREAQMAGREAACAVDRYGKHAAMVLLMRAQQTRSPMRRRIYWLARKNVIEGQA